MQVKIFSVHLIDALPICVCVRTCTHTHTLLWGYTQLDSPYRGKWTAAHGLGFDFALEPSL